MTIEAPAANPGSEVTAVRRRKRRRRRSSGHDRARRADRLVQAETVVAIAVAVAAIAFRIVFVTHAGGLWRDEVNSVNTANASSFAELWHLAEFESHPVSMILLLRAWMAIGLGGSDGMLRLFGLLGGLALPAAAWFALRRLTRSAALVSMAVLAVNPDIVRWTSTVRAWGIGAALGIVSLVLVREASVALTRRRIIFAVLVSVLAVQAAYQNAMLLAGIVAAAAVVASVRRRWVEAIVPVGIGAVACVSLLPYVDVFRRRAAWNAVGEQPVTLGDLAARAWDMANSSGTLVVTCALALVAIGLIAAVQWTASPSAESVNRSRRGVATYAAAAGMLGALALFLFYRQLAYPTQPWYYVGVLAFVAVSSEVAVASAVAARMARTALVVLAVMVLIGGSPIAWRALREPQTNIDAVASAINSQATAGDVVVVNPWYLMISLSRYYTGSAAIVTVPPMDHVTVHRYDLLKAAMQEPDPLQQARVRIQQALESGHRVWMVGWWDRPSNDRAEEHLPPPPLPLSGWNAGPYELSWAHQTAAFVRDHVVEAHDVPVDHSGGRFENASAVVVTGWK